METDSRRRLQAADAQTGRPAVAAELRARTHTSCTPPVCLHANMSSSGALANVSSLPEQISVSEDDLLPTAGARSGQQGRSTEQILGGAALTQSIPAAQSEARSMLAPAPDEAGS